MRRVQAANLARRSAVVKAKPYLRSLAVVSTR